MSGVEPQLLPERHDYTLLLLIDISLAVHPRIQPRLTGAAQQQELCTQAEIDCAAPHLTWVQERRDDQASIEILLGEGALDVISSENVHSAHAAETTLISIALPTRS